MFMELKKCKGARVINPNLKKSTNVLLIVLVAVISNTWALSYQRLVAEHGSHVGHFVAEEEAAVLASDQNIRLAMIPCNFSTQINCIYAKHLKDFLSIKHQNVPEIVVSWAPQGVNLDKAAYNGSALNFFDNSNREKPENDFFNFNWIFELLPCMILASAFEICLLVVRNLRNISLALWGFWSIFIEHLEKLCYLRMVAGAFNKSDNKYQQHRKRNVPISEKRTLSYIFAILTWRASQTAKGGSVRSEPNLRDDLACNALSYGPVTTMGDLLLLILFTHVYYQRQKFLDEEEKEAKADPEQYVQVDNKKDHRQNLDNEKLYDKHQINDRIRSRRVINKRCSHFCGNTYQQISLFQQQEQQQQQFQESQVKFSNLNITSSFCPLKLFYKTHCCDFECFNCCLCPYTCHSCYFCLSNCRRCFKSLKDFYDYCCCFQCCCSYQNAESYQKSSANYLCCRCQIYCQLVCKHCCFYNVPAINSCVGMLYALQKNHCCFYNAQSNNSCSWPLSFLYTLQKNHCFFHNAQANHSNVFALKLNSSNCCLWKLTINNQNYTLIHDNSKELWSLFYAANGRSMILYKPNYYQNAMKIFSSILPQNLINLKHYSTVLKWQKLQLAVMIITLIVISNSKPVKRDNHSHYYNSMFHRCHKHFSKKSPNKRRRRRKRRRYRHHQYGKMYRPQHYFYTTLIQCVKRQKSKKLHKKFLNKLPKKTAQHLKITSTTYEFSLNAAASLTTTKVAKIRAIKKGRGSKTNIVWLLIGLIWFEGPKLVNCNVLINYQNQQQQHDQQQQQQPSANVPKETTTNGVNTNMEYSNENFQQIKTKTNNNNSNSNNNNKSKTKNSNNTNNDSHNTSSTTPITTSNNNLHLSVNLLPIINTKHFKHYCKNNYYQKLIRSSLSSSYSSSMQRVQRALKTNQNLVNSLTSTSASHNNIKENFNAEQIAATNGFQNMNEEGHAQSDLMRLESIKHQILFKLGLTRKPNVSHPLPKQFIWDTIYRADGIKSFNEFTNSKNFPEQHQQHFMTQQSSPYWSAATTTAAAVPSLKVVPASNHQTRQRDDSYENVQNSQDFADGNTKRSLESKKYGLKSKQQLQQPHSKHFDNDIAYQQEATTATKILNELFYTTNRNKFNYTNKMFNNFTILKQSKHQQQQQQFHKNSQHSTITIHQQQNRRQHEQFNQYTNNNNNNNNNNKNNINNSNNNIIMVQKHLRNNINSNSNNNNNNNNKYIEEEAKKFTYLTDINSSKDDSLNNMNYHSPDFDDNNSILRKETHHHHHHQHYNQNHDNHQAHREKVSEHFQHLNIDMEHKLNLHLQHEIIHKDQVASDNNEADNDDHQHHRRHDNYFSKLDTYDENDDFFGSTQEIITFAEKGKMYKNHRLVEFSHQNQEKPKQKLHVRNAEIHIRIDKIAIKNKSRAGSGIKRKRLKIWIFQLIENNYTYKGFDHVAQFCASFEVDTSRLGWKKFDITTTVKEWYTRREGEKLRLLIDCTGCGKQYSVHLFNNSMAKTDISVRERRIADERRRNARLNEIDNKHFYNVTHNYETPNLPYNQSILVAENQGIAKRHEEEIEDNSSRPFLVLHTEARRQRRVRRRAINCNGALHGQCCKESFYVSFKALGWDDWIIAPRGYFANYCRGDCTGPYRTPDTFQTFHAHFIEEYRKMGLLNGMQPCCAPIKFSSMSLIYYGDEGIIKRDLPKMVVDECGCP